MYLQLLPTDMEMLTRVLPPPTCFPVLLLIFPTESRLADKNTAPMPLPTRCISLGTTTPTYLQLLPTDMEMLTMALLPPTCSHVPLLISPMGIRLAEEDIALAMAMPLSTIIDIPDIPT